MLLVRLNISWWIYLYLKNIIRRYASLSIVCDVVRESDIIGNRMPFFQPWFEPKEKERHTHRQREREREVKSHTQRQRGINELTFKARKEFQKISFLLCTKIAYWHATKTCNASLRASLHLLSKPDNIHYIYIKYLHFLSSVIFIQQ